MTIINESNNNITEEMFTSSNVNSCEYDGASCGCGN